MTTLANKYVAGNICAIHATECETARVYVRCDRKFAAGDDAEMTPTLTRRYYPDPTKISF